MEEKKEEEGEEEEWGGGGSLGKAEVKGRLRTKVGAGALQVLEGEGDAAIGGPRGGEGEDPQSRKGCRLRPRDCPHLPHVGIQRGSDKVPATVPLKHSGTTERGRRAAGMEAADGGRG